METDTLLIPPPDLAAYIGVPPRWFAEVGDTYLSYLKKYCDLKPTDDVLDMGCGSGRLTRPIYNYLTTGRYDGFDVSGECINWLQKTYQSDRFHFTQADIANKAYNEHGLLDIDTYKLPYYDNDYDVILAISLFTHILPEHWGNFLGQIKNKLRKGGRFFFTCLLDENRPIGGKATPRRERFDKGNSSDEYIVVIKRDIVMAHFKGWKVNHFFWGSWSGRKTDALSHQEIFVFQK